MLDSQSSFGRGEAGATAAGSVDPHEFSQRFDLEHAKLFGKFFFYTFAPIKKENLLTAILNLRNQIENPPIILN